jgi:adenine-specific DNA-methyltransferase
MWSDRVRANQVCRFGDLAEIKVGIKTTADSVFIHDDWDSFGKCKPEEVLLRSLITHHDASRWSIAAPGKTVLYPYDLKCQKRTPIELGCFPKSQAYLEQFRDRLQSRKYVVDSGRHWYEIWVPHQPAEWAKPKIVWPDISEQPKFFFDASGAIVNGDCYWIKLRPNVDPDWLYLMLAVANSEIATKFYDTMFHNKLYAGRRRFMTQYVKEFPLPELESKLGRQIVGLVKQLVEKSNKRDEVRVEAKVQSAFGFD